LGEHRRAQLVQSGKRQLHLGLNTIDLRDLETAGLLRDVCHQCCLADPSLAPQYQRPTLAAADCRNQVV
jgi:hypothetical protein